MAKKTFIFDLDDTLIANLHDYSFAQLRFVEFVINRLGWNKAPDAQTIINLQVEIDKKNVAKYGFGIERFPTSTKETYQMICEGVGIKDNVGAEVAYTIGMTAFNKERYKKKGLVPGAEETLDYLIAQNDEIILCTKGDKKVQEMKIEAINAVKWFNDQIYIVDRKNEGVLNQIVGDREKNDVYHVGNGIKSDVNPALEAGIRAIYIPRETWAYEKDHNGKTESNRLIELKNIVEIKDNYHHIFP